VPLEKLASVVMSQLARRDIWVFDVKIHELVKKEISFKETKGGIVIKNKKFLLDDESNLVMQEIPEATNSLVPVAAPPPDSQALINQVKAANPGRPIKFVTLDPDLPNVDRVKRSGLAFTVDKRYPVFKEYPHRTEVGTMIYTMHDDNKREVSVKDVYFVNADQILSNGFYDSVDSRGGNGAPKLAYENYENVTMPDIRRR
jgi:hypothetical protein